MSPDKSGGIARRWKIFIIISMITLVADQASKLWARDTLPTQRQSQSARTPPGGAVPCEIPDDVVSHECFGKKVVVIDGFWEWRLSFNPGSAFGLFNSQSGARVFLSVIGVAAVFGMLWMLKKAREDQRALIWALGLVAGGAVGNLIDRIYFGVVTDFVLWRYRDKEWPVFNIADVALVIGVGLMFVDIFGEAKREKEAAKLAEAAKGVSKDTTKSKSKSKDAAEASDG